MKQTEELEKKGYVTGSHAKLYGTSAFVTGTIDDEDDFEELSSAYGAGTNRAGGKIGTGKTTTRKSTTNKTTTRNNGKNPSGKPTTKKKKSTKKKKKGKSRWEKFEDWLGKLFDWVEVRLDRLSEKTERWGKLFEKFVDGAGSNAQSAYKAAISSAKNEQKYTTKASNRYLEEAFTVGLKGAKAAGKKKVKGKKVRAVSDNWVKDIYTRLLNDDLDEESISKYGEKKRGIIDAMQGYIDKARDAAKSTVELTDSINDLIKAQRDSKNEFNKSAFASVVETNNRYTAAAKNSALTQSSSVAQSSIGYFDTAVTDADAYLDKLGSQAQSAGQLKYKKKKVKGKKKKKDVAANTATKIYGKIKNEDDKKKYKKYMDTASKCIKSEKLIPQDIIDFFEAYNPSLAGKYEAWNMQVANLEVLRQEAADNYAENIKTIVGNINEQYANLDEETEDSISLIESQAENIGNSQDANKKLGEILSKRNENISNDKAEIKKYNDLISSYSKGINSKYKGSQYANASDKVQSAVKAVARKAIGCAKDGKRIPDNVMMSIYKYYVRGYLKPGFYESCLAYNLAFDSKEQATKQLEIDKETEKQEKLALYDKRASNISSHYDTQVKKIEAQKNAVNGAYEDTDTQDKIIAARKSEISELTTNLKWAVDNGILVEGTDQWLERVVEIQEKTNELNELKLTRFETEIDEKFERAVQKSNDLIDKFSTIKSLINEEMLYKKNSGELTEMGWLSVGLNSKALAQEKNNLDKYLKEREEVLKEYNENGTTWFGDKTFDEKIRELDSNILSTFGNMKSYNDELLSILEGQAEAELNALQKVIDKRKEALQKKKEYYDYDKTIKGKTKDLQSLEQQIRALEGVAGQEAAAKRANLMAQRQEAQEDLDDTVKEHIYDMQVTGLDEMMDNLQEKLEDWKQDLHGDLQAQKNAIDKLTAAYKSEKIPFNITISTLLNGTAGEQTVSGETVGGILSDGSKTLNKTGDKKDTTTQKTPVLTTTKPTTAKPTTAKPTTKKPTTAKPTTRKPTTAKPSTTTKKLTVTDSQARDAMRYILGALTFSEHQGKNWQPLNKDLWRKKDYDRRVYLPITDEKRAWYYLHGSFSGYSNSNLYQALRSTGIWSQLLNVRWDSKNKRVNTSGAYLNKVHGYAKGGTVHKSGQYLTDEKGEEIIITKQGILRPLSAGTSVIPADITERLYALASNYDMNANARVRGVDMSKIQRIGGETITPIINCPITIEGNANEQDVINAINKTLPKISKHVQNDIRKDLRKSGR